MDLNLLIERKRERFEQLEREMADPRFFENRKRAGEIMREHANIKEMIARWDELESARRQLDDNRELATSKSRRWRTTKFPTWRNELPILSAIFKSACFQQMKTKIEMRLSRSGPGRAAAKPRFLPPIFTACTIATRKRPD